MGFLDKVKRAYNQYCEIKGCDFSKIPLMAIIDGDRCDFPNVFLRDAILGPGGGVLAVMPSDYQNNKAIVMSCVHDEPRAYIYASPELQNDPDVVSVALYACDIREAFSKVADDYSFEKVCMADDVNVYELLKAKFSELTDKGIETSVCYDIDASGWYETYTPYSAVDDYYMISAIDMFVDQMTFDEDEKRMYAFLRKSNESKSEENRSDTCLDHEKVFNHVDEIKYKYPDYEEQFKSDVEDIDDDFIK